MKKLLSLALLLLSLTVFSQTRKLEATHKENGKAFTFTEGQRVKVTTSDRKKLVGVLVIKDAQTLNIEDTDIKIENLSSIKFFPKKGRTAKNILFGVGAALLATSGVLAADNNGAAFTTFAGGTTSIVVGALVNNKHKTLIHRHYLYKIVE
ncbi:hypothetical protein NAT51_05770 [Flavobacterium amniphilum]|uniref:hypothetical protein n=1 Tax=Flavobacterium amniphilum TaxID=1834035 RepID=UPI002029F7F8|nr:hypothetical protein [Flavobacterium amniphilum]MCL9805015.1 hypothetical protein [Flavobacterium amniphilum]